MIHWLASAALLANVPLASPATVEPDGRGRTSPNIVLILADDLGYGDLGCYGQKVVLTPNLDRMATEGMRFTQHYAGSTVCAPSRCVLMTGKHVGHAQIRGNYEVQPMGQWPLAADTVTVAGVLKSAGYQTALIGKWGLGGPGSTGHPNRVGFDLFFGYLCQRHAHNSYPEFLFRNHDRVPLDNVVAPEFRLRGDGAGVAAQKKTYAQDVLMKEALTWIDRHKDGHFFLCLTPTLPHANNEGADQGMEAPDLDQYKDTDWPGVQKNTAAVISRLDSDVGRVIDQLKASGLDRKTLVLFASDNGPHREGGNDPAFFESSGPLKGIKRDLYEGGIRVPLIAWWPGQIRAGQVCDHVSGFQDLLPTFANLAGVAHPRGIDGISMAPTLLGLGEQERHPYLYWEFYDQGGKQAVRMGDWKGVRLNVGKDRQGPIELYNLGTDLGETRDVAADHPDVVTRISQIMAGAHEESDIFKF